MELFGNSGKDMENYQGKEKKRRGISEDEGRKRRNRSSNLGVHKQANVGLV